MANLKNTVIDDTGYIRLPSGNTAVRPTSPTAGDLRLNTTSIMIECYNGSDWINLKTGFAVT